TALGPTRGASAPKQHSRAWPASTRSPPPPATPCATASTVAATAASTGRSTWPWSPACAWTPTPAPTLPSAPARVGRCARSDARSSATSPARSTDTSTPPRPPPRWPLDIHRRFNGRLEHLRGSALGFRNLTNYIARSLLETGGFRPQLHPRLGRAHSPHLRQGRPGARRGRPR